jgi:hypothetical protein
MTEVTVLIPTCDRPEALTVTLTGLSFQSYRDFSITVANQGSRNLPAHDPSFRCLRSVLKLHGHSVSVMDNLPPKGMAQQRQFLLDNTDTPYCLFLDDDVLLEPYVLRNLVQVIKREQCGFVGCPLIGLSYAGEYRPREEVLEFWEGRVQPEAVTPGSRGWERHRLHNAANVLHVQKRLELSPHEPQPYKVAWVGGCVLYDTGKLRAANGFTFWHDLPEDHCGEDVLAQLRVMKRYGGCGILPSGAYHQELPTTIPRRKVNAPECLDV